MVGKSFVAYKPIGRIIDLVSGGQERLTQGSESYWALMGQREAAGWDTREEYAYILISCRYLKLNIS